MVCTLSLCTLTCLFACAQLVRVQGKQERAAPSKTWIVPSHLSADKTSDEDWASAGIANEESLSSLAEIGTEKNAKQSGIPFLRLAARGMYLVLLFWPVVWSSALAYFIPWFRVTIWYKLLRWAIENSGAAFIKWGQWSSTRPDMFPVELCDKLTKLQSGAPVHKSYQCLCSVIFNFDSFMRRQFLNLNIPLICYIR